MQDPGPVGAGNDLVTPTEGAWRRIHRSDVVGSAIAAVRGFELRPPEDKLAICREFYQPRPPRPSFEGKCEALRRNRLYVRGTRGFDVSAPCAWDQLLPLVRQLYRQSGVPVVREILCSLRRPPSEWDRVVDMQQEQGPDLLVLPDPKNPGDVLQKLLGFLGEMAGDGRRFVNEKWSE